MDLSVWSLTQPQCLTFWHHSSPPPPFKFLSIWFTTMHRLRSECADGNTGNKSRCLEEADLAASHSTQEPVEEL